jgi:hypothetical protein
VPLDARSVVDFLLERGAIRPADVLDGDLTVHELTSRNANFAVRRKGMPGLFVKQAPPGDPLHRSTLLGEIRLARAAARDESFAALHAVSPAHRLDDEADAVLVLDLVDGAEDLDAVAGRSGGVPEPLAAALGRAVAELHRGTAAAPRGGDGPAERRAWILFFTEMDEFSLPPDSPPHRQLQRIVREDSELSEGLAALRDDWRTEALVHGDLKWENVLVDPDDPTRVWLVDWEMSGFGDPAWDVGGLLHAFLRHWIGLLPEHSLASGATAADLLALARMRPSIAATWSAYVAVLPSDDPDDLMARATRMCAARLLQTAFEHVSGNGRLSHHALGLTQLAANIMARPDEALRTLFGLEPGAGA